MNNSAGMNPVPLQQFEPIFSGDDVGGCEYSGMAFQGV